MRREQKSRKRIGSRTPYVEENGTIHALLRALEPRYPAGGKS
jgi:hypothetical protein